ncbi:hypothetical protein KUTeg_019638 [Tegillarca granosa]|uniref:Uncharacterized protein n=1 Tax=Tegillarca granosa TaxID=220873 RepID=A0ABQ9EH62_TEGGR|nr:hypothetical protein KUTeg_019638 [Tegillarca granosa]
MNIFKGPAIGGPPKLSGGPINDIPNNFRSITIKSPPPPPRQPEIFREEQLHEMPKKLSDCKKMESSTERVRTHGSVKPTTANYWNPLGLSVSYKNRFYLATGILEKKILGNAN